MVWPAIFFIYGKVAWQQGIDWPVQLQEAAFSAFLRGLALLKQNSREPSASGDQGKGIFSHFRTCFVTYNLPQRGQRAAVNICQAYTGCLLSSRTSKRGKENITGCFSSLCVVVQSESVLRFFCEAFFWGRWLPTSMSFPRKAQDASLVAVTVGRAASWGGDIVSHISTLASLEGPPCRSLVNTVP